MPPDTAPGQVLSSVFPASEKRSRSKLGGCASVLFQIFNGKRLFPRKSLPAERHKHGSINHTEDKLPIAKLLLIADENRCGSLKDAEEEFEEQIEEYVPNDEPRDEEKVSKRTPGVVAKLMGLDSMPSPDLTSGEKNRLELQRKDTDCQFVANMPQENAAPLEKSWKTSARVQPYTSSHMARTRESKTSLPKKFTTQQKTLFWKDKARNGVKSIPTTKSPSLPPHHLDASFPSVLSSSKKGDNVYKSPLRMPKAARLLEGAAKMLEASTHHNTQNRKHKLENLTSKSRMGSLNVAQDLKGQSIKEQVLVDVRNEGVEEMRAPRHRQDETKAREVHNEMVSRKKNASSAVVSKMRRPQVGRGGHDEGPGGGRGTLYEAAPGQRKGNHQDVSKQPRSDLLEKVKADWRRQEETSRRLSQPAVHRLKSLGAARTRHPSPPKSCQDSSGGPCSSQASNSTRRSFDGTVSSHLSGSHVGSNQAPSKQLSSSSADVENSSDLLEIVQPSQSVYHKTAGLSHGNVSLVKALSMPISSQFGEADDSFNSQDESISSAIYTESHQRSSMESLLSSDPSSSECAISSEECSSFPIRLDLVGHESAEEAWGHDKRNSKNDPKRPLDSLMDEDSSQGNFESLPSDMGDTQMQSEASSKLHKSSHTYSGKNTAAILQELLIALSSSSSHQTSQENKRPSVESTEPCTSDSDLGQPEIPRVLPEVNSLYTEDSQDLASCNSSDSSEIQQILGSKLVETKLGFLEETQGEEESSADMQDTAQTCFQRGLPEAHTNVVDCEALMSTLFKLHDIDPKVIGLNVKAQKHNMEDQITASVVPGGGLSVNQINSLLFDKLEEQAQQQQDWGVSNSTTVSAEEGDEDSVSKSDMESSLRNGYDEVAAQNKKLLTDCINEAFKSLSKQLYEVSSSISEQSSANHVLNRVYKQIDEWRGMAISMNLDDMVEKEMKLTTRRWCKIGAETEEIAEAVESNILSGLMEEILLELI